MKIFGSVQGVNFRSQLRDIALGLDIAGLAKNEPDGSVSVEAEGEERDLQKLLNLCYNGIRYAQVTMIDAIWDETQNSFRTFVIE